MLHIDFIFDGDQFSGLPVLGGSEAMIFRNSSKKFVGWSGISRNPSEVFLSMALSPICSRISGGMQSLPFESILR